MRYPLTLAACLAAYVALPTHAATARDAHGTWLSADQAAIIEFKECTDAPGALCGQIVWDKDAGTPADACGVRIAKLKRWDGEAWRDGWVHDPRSKKNYKGVLRAHQHVFTAQGEGETTSGTFSPTLEKAIAMARLPLGVAVGEQVEVDIRGKRLKARVVKASFVRKGQALI